MFEKTMQQTNKEINDAKGAVKSYSTRISKQYGVLNVTKRIERKLKSIEWPRNEERSEVDYTKDNPGPGSYDPIIESNLPQRSQQFLKQKRLFIPVQKLQHSSLLLKRQRFGAQRNSPWPRQINPPLSLPCSTGSRPFCAAYKTTIRVPVRASNDISRRSGPILSDSAACRPSFAALRLHKPD